MVLFWDFGGLGQSGSQYTGLSSAADQKTLLDVVDVDSVQEETISVEMQNYSDVMSELKSSQQLYTQLETRYKEQSTQLELTKATMDDNQQAFHVMFPCRFSFICTFTQHTKRHGQCTPISAWDSLIF